jgi:DNA-directed RNA polymerase specialized sigma24 family protein
MAIMKSVEPFAVSPCNSTLRRAAALHLFTERNPHMVNETTSEAPRPRDRLPAVENLLPRDGEGEYMEAFMDSHYPRNLGAAFRWTRGDQFALDLTQEGSIKVLLAYRRNVELSHPGAYALKVAFNAFLDTVDSATSKKERLTFEGILPERAGPPNPLHGDYDVTSGLEFLELLAEVQERYRGHPRVAEVALMTIEGYSGIEIAKMLKTNRPAVSRDLARFRQAAREHFHPGCRE